MVIHCCEVCPHYGYLEFVDDYICKHSKTWEPSFQIPILQKTETWRTRADFCPLENLDYVGTLYVKNNLRVPERELNFGDKK